MATLLYLGIAFTIFTILLFLSRRPLTLEGKLISAFMFFLGFPLFIKLQIIGEFKIPFLKFFFQINTCPLIYGPFLYLYARLKVAHEPLFKYKYLLHFLPYILFTLIAFTSFYTDSGSSKIIPVDFFNNGSNSTVETNKLPKKQEIYSSGAMPDAADSQKPEARMLYESPRSKLIHSLLNYFTLLSFFTYGFFIHRILSKHKKNISDYFSHDSIGLNLKWLHWINICFVISPLFYYGVRFLELRKYVSIIPLQLLPDAGLLFFIFIFCFFAVRQPVIFSGADKHETSLTDGIKKYKNSRLKKEEEEKYVNILEKLMETEKPYLNECLTSADVSGMLGIPKYYLTQVINENFNKNFFMYINEYRVKNAIELMADKNYSNYNILRIAYASGFNSKTAFNRFFKNFVGCTPTEYRKRINNSGA